MFKIFKYKSMYEDAENERCDLELEFDKYKSDKTKELDNTKRDYEDKIKKLESRVENLENSLSQERKKNYYLSKQNLNQQNFQFKNQQEKNFSFQKNNFGDNTFIFGDIYYYK